MLVTILSAVVTANTVTVNKERTQPSDELSTKGSYIEITKIEPYLYIIAPFVVVLCFSAELKNTGDEPYIGDIGYSATAYNKHGRIVETTHVTHSGGLNPDESWFDINHGYGLWFDGWYIPPKYYKLEFYSIPSNDYEMAKYKIFGDGFYFNYEYEEVNYSSLDLVPRILYHSFLEKFPILHWLFQRLI
jgi:hypothetical protein